MKQTTTAKKINPFISNDPALDRKLQAKIDNCRKRNDELTKALKVEESLLRRGTGAKAETKAEIAKLKAAIKANGAAQEAAQAAMPKQKINTRLAVAAYFADIFTAETYQALKDDFIDRFTASPSHAIEWKAGQMVEAETKYAWSKRLIDWYENRANTEIGKQNAHLDEISQLKEMVNLWTEEMTSEIMRNLTPSSSNSYDNLNRLHVNAALKDLIDHVRWNRLDWYIKVAAEDGTTTLTEEETEEQVAQAKPLTDRQATDAATAALLGE